MIRAIIHRFGSIQLAVVGLIVGFFLLQIASRMPETNARRRRGQARMGMKTLSSLLEDHVQKTSTLPEMRPLSTATGDDESLIEEIKSARGENLGTYSSDLAPDLADPFSPDRSLPYAYHSEGAHWMLSSAGPDLDYDLNPKTVIENNWTTASTDLLLLTYDPTNGMTSNGDIYLTGSFKGARQK